MEYKVEKVFTDPDSGLIKAILYREWIPTGLSNGYMLFKVETGEKIFLSAEDLPDLDFNC